jgi:hypothetical protein
MIDNIAFADDLLEYVEEGSKEITIRKGARMYEQVLTVTDPAGEVQPYQIEVTTQYQMVARELPESDIQLDGFENREDMVEGMQNFYPDFDLDTICTVVKFVRL